MIFSRRFVVRFPAVRRASRSGRGGGVRGGVGISESRKVVKRSNSWGAATEFVLLIFSLSEAEAERRIQALEQIWL